MKIVYIQYAHIVVKKKWKKTKKAFLNGRRFSEKFHKKTC